MSAQFHPLNVSPFATNVLDLVGDLDLVTENRDPVTIRQNAAGWLTIQVGTRTPYTTPDNLDASYYLNQCGVGRLTRTQD